MASSIFVTIFGNAKPFTASLGQAQKQLGSFSKSVAGSSGIAGGAFAGVGVAAGLMAAASAKAFLNFDDQMTKSTAIMSGVTDSIRKDMEATARAVAKSSTFGAAEAAEAYFFLASAGLDAAQSMEALPKVAQFAQAGNFDLARATDLLTDAQSALGLSVDDTAENMENMNRVSDVLVKANTLANASVEQFSEALTTKAGASLKAVGKDIEEGVAVLAAFADQGVKGSEAGTALSIVMRDLQTKAIGNKDAWAALGVSAFDTSGEMLNMGEIVAGLEDRLVGLSDEQQKTTLLQLGFTDKSVSYIQALLGQSEAIAEYESALKSAGGTTEEVANKQLGSFTNQLKVGFIAPLQDASISLGKLFVPALVGVGTAIGKVMPFLEDFISGLEVIIGWVSGLPDILKVAAAAIVALKTGLLGLAANPVVAGLTLVAGLVALIGQNSQEAEARADGLAGKLAEFGKGGGLTRWLEEVVAGNKDLQWAMADTGVTVGELAVLVQDGSLALEDYADNTRGNKDAIHDLAPILQTLRSEYESVAYATEQAAYQEEVAAGAAEIHEKAMLAQEQAARKVQSSLDRVTPTTEEAAEATKEAAAAAQAAAAGMATQREEALRLVDPIYNVYAAVQNAADAEAHLNEVRNDSTATQDELTDAVLEAARAHAEMQIAQSNSVAAGPAAVEAFIAQMEAAGATAGEIAAAKRALDIYNSTAVSPKTFLLTVQQITEEITDKKAQAAAQSGVEFHRGGVVGEPASNEVDARLLKGETVRTEEQEAALARNLASGGSGGPISVTVVLDGEVLARTVAPILTDNLRLHIGAGR